MKKKNEDSYDLYKKPVHPNLFFMIIEWLGAFFLSGPLGLKTKFRYHNEKKAKPPYLILSNHASIYDFSNMSLALFPHRACWVVSIEEFNGREWLLRKVGCFPKRKFTKDMHLIKTIINIIQKEKLSVVIYPEARFSLAGITEDTGEALGKLAKLCKAPVVIFNQRGTFLKSPQWNKKPTRKVKCEADFTVVATKEEVLELPPDELQKRIMNAFDYDEYKWQSENHILVKSKYRAHNIHRILYKCPECGAENMDSCETNLWCNNCHSKWELDEYGNLQSYDKINRFNTPSDWYRWERECVNDEVEKNDYSFEDDVRIEKLISSKTGFKNLGTVHFTQNSTGITLEGKLDDGSDFFLHKSPMSTSSIHIEYNFKNRGDALDIATIDETYFVFPLTQKNKLTKIHFATEALFNNSKQN